MSVWKFGDNIDTDQMIAGRYLSLRDPAALAGHLFETLRPGLAADITPGDIVAAGSNFGCGSAREHAVRAFLGAGVRQIIVESCARTFFRISVNLGLEILQIADTSDIHEGDSLKVLPAENRIQNRTTGNVYDFAPMPEFLQRIIRCGGLVAYAKRYLVDNGPETGSRQS